MPVSTFDPLAPHDSTANWAVAQRFVGTFAPHAQATPDMTVALDKGHLLDGTTLVEVNPQSVGPFTSPSVRRVDRIVVNRATGTASLVTGMDGSLVPPAIPVGTLPVARVVLESSTVVITNDALFDERSFVDLSVSGGTLNPTLAALGALDAAPGLLEQTGADVFTKRILGVGTPASVPTRADADARYLSLAGGTLTGALTLDGAPTTDLEAATKGYVDDSVQTLDARYLPLAGGTLTGALMLPGVPVGPLQAATKSYVDAVTQDFTDSLFVRGTVAGTANAIDLIAPADVDTLPPGMKVHFKAASTTTGSATFNLNGLGALPIVDSTFAAVPAGTIVSGRRYDLTYDEGASGRWVVGGTLASEGVAGAAAIATQTEVNAGTDNGKFITALKAATRYLAKVGGRLTGVLLPPTTVTLTDGAMITPDLAAGHDFVVTLGGNRTLANPTNISANQGGSIVIKQDGAGSRTLAFGGYFKFPNGTAPPLTTTANATDRLDYWCESVTVIHANLSKKVS